MPDAPRDADIAEVVQTLQRIIQSVHLYSRRSLRRFGLTGPQIWALLCIRSAGSLTMSGLAASMYLHISTVSGLIDRLEERGLVERRRTDDDRRITRLSLTPRARTVLQRTPEPPRSRLPRGLRRLSDRELRALRDSMRLLARIMEARDTGVEEWS